MRMQSVEVDRVYEMLTGAFVLVSGLVGQSGCCVGWESIGQEDEAVGVTPLGTFLTSCKRQLTLRDGLRYVREHCSDSVYYKLLGRFLTLLLMNDDTYSLVSLENRKNGERMFFANLPVDDSRKNVALRLATTAVHSSLADADIESLGRCSDAPAA